MRLFELDGERSLMWRYSLGCWVATARERSLYMGFIYNDESLPQSHHKSDFPSLTSERIPLSALIEGVKKYSPPRGITNGLTALSFTALFASCGNMPVMSTCSLLLSWPKTASKPTPGLTKFRSLAHWPWMKAKPLLMVLW